jgi:hypothetical protein
MQTLESTEALILSGEGYELEVSPDIIAQKAKLIEHSALIVQIADPVSSDAAGLQIKKLGTMRNVIEKSRTTIKAPVLAVGKRIDTLASEFQAEIAAEETRLKKLQGEYAQAVIAERNRINREIEAKRQEEEKARREAEAIAAKSAAEAEEARRKAEEAAFNATTPEEDAAAAKAAEDAAKLEADRVAAAHAQADLISNTPAPAFVPAAPKGVKMVVDFEVTDLDALYRHDASLVTLTAKRAEILKAIGTCADDSCPPSFPGLRVFLKPQVR